ncbi:response regulator transcription factor [Thalassomonas actiniarum]|uniref:Response regulator transcription factor n=1 Tax=Thalassomonas actiniarum TaxID=485447 RepID=A0AAF0C299_9GAMM|nr:response regulator transcription factor [Thalassomonas actiniarum]WDD99831.1 response regulator transcription factor [Thalassomonas actiniarum]
MKLLIIEDSERLRKSLELGLTRLDFTVAATGDGSKGLELALYQDYDLIILDLMLPSLDGLSILKTLRAKKKNTAVLILSAKDELQDRVKGLEIGADDYLCKPFAFDELHARINCLLRRAHHIELATIEIAGLVIDVALRQVMFKDELIKLTPHEYTIFEHLAANRGRIITYASLENYLYDNFATVTRNAIEAHVSALRRKLRQACGDAVIKTRRGFGYLIEKA